MKVVIVGGGIAGLSTAYYLQKETQALGLACQITLIEREGRLGGKIVTDTPNGFVIEAGPDSFITQKPHALQLCRELGLDEQLIGTNDDRRTIYVLRKGKLHKMPDGLMLVVPTRFLPFVKSPLISWRGKLRMGMDWLMKARQSDADESIADFMRRRLGQEALEVLGEPILAGIHVADAERLSLKATFPRFMEIERKYGSLARGMIAGRKNAPPSKQPMFMTMKGGLQDFITALENAFEGEIITGTGVQSLSSNDFGWSVQLEAGQTIAADGVILATPAYVSADFLQEDSPELAQKLRAIRYASTATLSLGYAAADFEHPLDGFGFVIPRTEATPLLACTWTSTKFNHRAPQGHVMLRVFVGGPRQSELVNKEDDDLVTLVQSELQKIMGITAKPTITRVFRWKNANPQYDVGHLEFVDQLEASCPDGLYLTGSAYRGVGLPDCIAQGQQTAQKTAAYLMQLAHERVLA